MSQRLESLSPEEIKQRLGNGQQIREVKFVVFKSVSPHTWRNLNIEFDSSKDAEDFVEKELFDCDVAILKRETSIVKLREKNRKKRSR